jgi:oligopeptide/dipeptide ABC transporter ATP-binding protein
MGMTEEAAIGADTPLLDIRDLRIQFRRGSGPPLPVLDGVSLTVNRGETVGIVGESGSGKSVLSLSILGLLPGGMHIGGGEIWYDGRHPLHRMSGREIRALRGKEIAMIFQDPMSSLNPGLAVGDQVTETLRLHLGYSRREAKEHAIRLLRKVGLPRPESLFGEYPHQLSGGMRQRVMIAIAVSCNPGLLIADEPTTALDVTIQAQILDLMRTIREEDGTSILLISHDISVIADMCDRVLVMYAGQILESGTIDDVFERPLHPYTAGLLRSIPTPAKKNSPLDSIEGRVPAPHERSAGCPFASRCPHAVERCRTEMPELVAYRGNHAARCFLAETEGAHRHAAV